MMKDKRLWLSVFMLCTFCFMMTIKLDDAYAASKVEFTGDITPLKCVEDGETYIQMKDFDMMFGEVTTDTKHTQIDVKYVLENQFMKCNVLDMRIYTDNKGDKEVVFTDSEGIIHEKSNLEVKDNKAVIPVVKAVIGQPVSFNAPKGITSEYGFKWVQLFNGKGTETITIGEEKVDLNMDKYQSIIYNSYTTASFEMSEFKKIDECITICYTVDAKGRLSKIAGMYNVVASADAVVDNLKEIKTVARGTYSLKIGWDKPACANGYRIYMRKNGTWKYIADISSREFAFTGLSAGTSYVFAVRPFYNIPNMKTTFASKATTITTFTKPLRPTKVVASKRAYTAIKISWTKSAGATGYALYKQVGGRWVRVKNVATNSYTFTGLKRNTTYKFAVRPYKIAGGKVDYAASYTPITTKTLK